MTCPDWKRFFLFILKIISGVNDSVSTAYLMVSLVGNVIKKHPQAGMEPRLVPQNISESLGDHDSGLHTGMFSCAYIGLLQMKFPYFIINCCTSIHTHVKKVCRDQTELPKTSDLVKWLGNPFSSMKRSGWHHCEIQWLITYSPCCSTSGNKCVWADCLHPARVSWELPKEQHGTPRSLKLYVGQASPMTQRTLFPLSQIFIWELNLFISNHLSFSEGILSKPNGQETGLFVPIPRYQPVKS